MSEPSFIPLNNQHKQQEEKKMREGISEYFKKRKEMREHLERESERRKN